MFTFHLRLFLLPVLLFVLAIQESLPVKFLCICAILYIKVFLLTMVVKEVSYLISCDLKSFIPDFFHIGFTLAIHINHHTSHHTLT